MTDELSVLGPQETTVTFNGEQIRITPIRMGKLQAFTKAVKPITKDLIDALEGTVNWMQVIESNGDSLIEAVHIATDVPHETLQNAMADEFIRLTAAVLEVNTDFFIRRLLPEIRKAVEVVTKAVKAGRT